VAVRPLRPATDRRFGGPLPHQLANQTRVHPGPPEFFTQDHAVPCAYAVLPAVSSCYPPVRGRFPTRYSPVRHYESRSFRRSLILLFTVRLACVRHAASVHPEPGSNSHVKMISKPLPRFRRSKALCPFLADQTLTVISYLSSGYTLKCIVLYFSEFLSTLPRPALDSCVSCSCGWSWNLQGCISVRLSNRCSGFHQRACRTGPFLCASPWETQLRHHIICISVCQQLFYFFFLLPQNQML
jgi:hypothetical protein